MAWADDWTIDLYGNIRYVGSGTCYSIDDLQRGMSDKADDASVAVSGDNHDITDYFTSKRTTNKNITLQEPLNIDDRSARYLYGGSITQDGGDTIYDGIVVFAPYDTDVYVVQNDNIICPAHWSAHDSGDITVTVAATAGTFTRSSGDFFIDGFEVGQTVKWEGFDQSGNNVSKVISALTATVMTVSDNTGLVNETGDGDERVVHTFNADSSQGISQRFLIKVRENGADIDGRRLIGLDRKRGKTYSEFKINGTERGENVLSFPHEDDLNDTTAEATIAGYTSITNTSEGYNEADADVDDTVEPYYSLWDTNQPTNTTNDFFERAKWLSQNALAIDSAGEYGTDYPLANATITGQAQSFTMGTTAQNIVRASFRLRKVGSPTGPITFVLYDHSGTYGTSSVPGTLRATSQSYEAADLTTAYQTVTLDFQTAYLLAASTNYVIAVEHAVIDGSNYIEVLGDATGSHGGNQSDETATVWTAAAAEDLWFKVYASPVLYGISGEKFRGITHEIDVDNHLVADFVEPESLSWTEGGVPSTGQLLAVDETSQATGASKLWVQVLSGIPPTDGTQITANGGATCDVNVAVTERTISKPFVGQSTGSAIIGGYGVGVQPADLTTVNDKLTDLNNAQHTAPGSFTYTLDNIVSGYDILVARRGYRFAYDNEGGTPPFQEGETLTFTSPAGTAKLAHLTDNGSKGWMYIGPMLTGSAPQDNSTITGGDSGATADVDGSVENCAWVRQFTLATALDSDPETSVVVNETIPISVPQSGTLRVVMDDGNHRLINYSAWDGPTKTFTISGTENFLSDQAAVNSGVYITYIDKQTASTSESFSGFGTGSNETMFNQVRDGSTPGAEWTGIGTFGGADVTVSAGDLVSEV